MGQNKQAGGRLVRPPRGFSAWSALVVVLVVVGIVLPGIRAMPSFIEYFSVKRAAAYAKQQSANRREVAQYFDKQAQIDRITALRGEDLDVQENEAGAVQAVSFSYRSEVPVYGPLSLLITYSGTQY